jgi:PIN domain nuclease of toxin-antitoxin system
VILLDTHIWVWWANDSDRLSNQHKALIERHSSDGLGVSVISCWEVCKLVEKGRLKLSTGVRNWIESATTLPNVVLLPLTPQMTVESIGLPTPFHADPADQLIVATARVLGLQLLTADRRLVDYPGVPTL